MRGRCEQNGPVEHRLQDVEGRRQPQDPSAGDDMKWFTFMSSKYIACGAEEPIIRVEIPNSKILIISFQFNSRPPTKKACACRSAFIKGPTKEVRGGSENLRMK